MKKFSVLAVLLLAFSLCFVSCKNSETKFEIHYLTATTVNDTTTYKDNHKDFTFSNSTKIVDMYNSVIADTTLKADVGNYGMYCIAFWAGSPNDLKYTSATGNGLNDIPEELSSLWRNLNTYVEDGSIFKNMTLQQFIDELKKNKPTWDGKMPVMYVVYTKKQG